MYEHLANTVIDKKNNEYEDFPATMDGEIYISGSINEGWVTKANLTAIEEQIASQESINIEARAYLHSTGWYVERFAETGKEIPPEIKKLRQEARERII